MAAKTLTRPQFEALRTAERYEGEVPPSGTPLLDELLISARPATVRVLIRLGLAREIVIVSGIEREELVFPVLTYAGELLRATMERGGALTRLDRVAAYVADAGPRPERRPAVATYYPAEEGCTTWREAEARPFKINGERVSAVVEAYGTRVTLFVGGRIVFEGAVPLEVRTSADVNGWARRTALAEVPARDEREAAWDAHVARYWAEYGETLRDDVDADAYRSASDNADDTSVERGFAVHSVAWFETFDLTYERSAVTNADERATAAYLAQDAPALPGDWANVTDPESVRATAPCGHGAVHLSSAGECLRCAQGGAPAHLLSSGTV